MHTGSAGGYVLAGGASRRMGRDKALLLWKNGENMLRHTADLVLSAVGNATILGPVDRYAHFGLPVLEDAIPDCGPLGGIYTALLRGEHERVLVAPVDLPFLTVDFLRRLLAEAADCACVIAKGQPLCGVYHASTLPAIEEAIGKRMLRVTALAASLDARESSPDDPRILQNRNTPEDWQ
jgi:molybdopterin-guanine dinucleotide biosynthesis protein A